MRLEMCDDCEWNWININMWYEARGGFNQPNEESRDSRGQFEGLSSEQFKQRTKELVDEAKRLLEAGEKALLAGEMSGHIFFADRYFGYDDAIYASLRLLEILSETGMKLRELLADVPRTFTTPEIRVDCPDRIKFRVVEAVKEYYRKTHDIISIDGIRIPFGDGWGLLRASNTQPVLVLRFEAASEERLTAIRSNIEGVLNGVLKSFD